MIGNPFGGTALRGIFFAPAPADQALNTRVLVARNTITGLGTNAITALGPPFDPSPSVAYSQFVDNVTSDNGADGILLRTGNNNNLVRGNLAEVTAATGSMRKARPETCSIATQCSGTGPTRPWGDSTPGTTSAIRTSGPGTSAIPTSQRGRSAASGSRNEPGRDSAERRHRSPAGASTEEQPSGSSQPQCRVGQRPGAGEDSASWQKGQSYAPLGSPARWGQS